MIYRLNEEKTGMMVDFESELELEIFKENFSLEDIDWSQLNEDTVFITALCSQDLDEAQILEVESELEFVEECIKENQEG